MAEMRSLENLWSEARSVDIGNQLTDGRLVSLGRIHLSIHSLILYARPEGWREEHPIVLERIGRLFDECLLRCRHAGDKAVRASFIPLLYRLGMPEYQPLDTRRWKQCDRQADRVIHSWAEEGTVPWESFHGIMRAVTELFNESGKAERQGDPIFLRYAETLAGWRREASDARMWENLSCREVLSRLDLFCRNSTLLLDNSYDEWILSVYASYRQSVYLESLSDEAWFLLLALEQWSEQFRHDPAVVTRIQSDAAGRMGNQGPGTDGYWAALSVLVESLCMERIEPFLV